MTESNKLSLTKPPFKLCFREKTSLGSSYILPSRPKDFVHYVTRKFHTKDDLVCNEEVLENAKNSYDSGPKEKYPNPILESHRYGWYSDVSFRCPRSATDRRFNFPRAMNPIFAHSDR